MKSIKLKLFIGILLILSVFLGGMLIYGSTFKSYFQMEKLKEMTIVIGKVEEIINKDGIVDITRKVENISETYNVQVEIEVSETGEIICSTHNNGRNGMMGHMMGTKNKYEVLEFIGNEADIEKNIILDKSTGVKFLTSSKVFRDLNYYIKVSTPINIIDEALSKSLNLQVLIFTPITIIIFIITAIYSDIFTKPILEIRKKTRKIEELNFQGELQLKGNDEIAELGISVNNLSNKIENTMEELKDKNLRLQEMYDKERENEILRKEFVSSVSHELKSPIAVISGYAQVLEAGVISSKEDLEYYISVINDESRRMQVIVNDLLDLYKLESNTFKLELEEISMDDLLKKIIKKNSMRFEEEEINLKVSYEHLLIHGDAIRIEQAIQNYINNALSHVDKKKILDISLKSYDNTVEISVYNSGNKIAKEDIEKIWKGFVRIDKVRNYKEKRVGLGLTIVKQIVDLHNGICGVENQLDGVKFWFRIPAI